MPDIIQLSRRIVGRSFHPHVVNKHVEAVRVGGGAEGAAHQHNADLVTVHRVRNFRELAMDLDTGVPE